jgi:hypothetical protein
MITRFDAIHSLVGGSISGSEAEVYYNDGQTPPTEEAIQEKLTELRNAEPMRVLREERNQKLAETDWWCCSDRTPTQAQLNYRVALRNLPSTESPSFDDNGELTNVNWPEKPE